MKVKDAIDWLQKLPDKEISLLIDCPFCGRGNQLGHMSEAVILHSREPQKEQEK